MITCDICDVEFEHRLELVEHQASLSHQIRVGVNIQKGEKRECPVCNFSCAELAEYSKHVDSDSHLTKLRALRSRRIGMVDSSIPCLPFKKNSRFESPAFYPSNLQQPPPPNWPHPPVQPTQPIQPDHFSSFFRPSIHTVKSPYNQNQRKGDGPTTPIPPHRQQHLQPGPSNRKSIYKKDNRKNGQLNGGNGGSPIVKKKEEIKKKKGGVIAKVLASSAAIIKKKKEIVTTPKVTSMDNKSKRYESLALKGAGMVMATNKSRTQAMMMERQVKYSLVERQPIEESRGNGSISSVPSISAPPPLLNRHLSSPLNSPFNSSFNPSTASDSTYAFCHPVHSTPHQLHDSNWPEFVRGINALHDDTPSSSTICPSLSMQGVSGSYVNGGRLVKEEVRDDEEIAIAPLSRPIKEEPSSSHQSLSMDSLNEYSVSNQNLIREKEGKLKSDCEEQKKRLSVLSFRRAEIRRRFDEEMREIDEEEKREKEKLATLESARASFNKDLRKFIQSHGF